MTTYEIREGLNGDILIKIEDGVESFVPMAEDNSDYQRYLNPEVEHLTEIPTEQVLGSAYGTYPARADRRAATQPVQNLWVLGAAIQERQTLDSCAWSTPCLGNL